MVSVAVQIARLPDANMEELRHLWREVFGSASPHPNNRQFMSLRIAHQLQVNRYGSLDALNRKRLQDYAEDLPKKIRSEHRISRPLPGTVIVRQWHGVEHRVMVLHRGFEYRDVQYNSLTEIAHVITGAHWSGPLFFGLARRPAKGARP